MPTSRAPRPHAELRSRLRRPAVAAAIAAAAGLSLGLAAWTSAAQPAGPGARKPAARTSACATQNCHTSIMSKPMLHKPVADRDCLQCHEYANPAQHTFTVREQGGNSCVPCHEPHPGGFQHDPVAQGQCLSCHDAHGSEHPALLTLDPQRELCQSCHDPSIYLEQDFVHGPVAVQACAICHQPHASDTPGLLRKPTTELCQDCHAEQKPPTGMSPMLIHTPARDDCTLCHDPHAQKHRFQLAETAPTLCYSCHEDVHEAVDQAAYKHGPVVETEGCPKCHNPHFSEHPKLQRASQPELCLDCHDRPVEASNGQILTNMAKLLAENPNQHGPIRQGRCTACHQPHAEKHFRLLHNEFPPEFYAPFDLERYRLCFTCHDPELTLQEAGTGLTNFRDGDKNLHFVHVNRENGRTCRACHEVHASKNPFHITDEVPYGTTGWMLPINYEQTETGGSCTPGCHKTRSYDRSTIGSLIKTPVPSSNAP